jgi:DNA-directed RNA polymerase specialized sigma24 family protein
MSFVDEEMHERGARLDRAPRSSTVRAVSTGDRLRGEDWSKLQAKLTLFAHGRTRKRSWHLAEDLAQTAIADLLARPESWDPEKEPLLKHLAKRVIGLAANEWHSKRSSLERLHGSMGGDDEPDVDVGEESLDEVIDRRRVAADFRARLDASVGGDEDGALVVTLMAEQGIGSAASLAKASGLPKERMRSARDRVTYRAKAIAQQMGEELDAAEDARAGLAGDDDGEEVET